IFEPAHENFSLPQFHQPLFRRKSRWTRQDEIRLAGQNVEAKLCKFAAELLPGGNDLAKVRAIVRQVLQRRQSGHLSQAVDIVAVANFIQRSDEVRVPDEIPDALEAE